MIHPQWAMFLEEEKKNNKQKVDSLLGYTTNYEEKDLYAIDSFLMFNFCRNIRKTDI